MDTITYLRQRGKQENEKKRIQFEMVSIGLGFVTQTNEMYSIISLDAVKQPPFKRQFSRFSPFLIVTVVVLLFLFWRLALISDVTHAKVPKFKQSSVKDYYRGQLQML